MDKETELADGTDMKFRKGRATMSKPPESLIIHVYCLHIVKKGIKPKAEYPERITLRYHVLLSPSRHLLSTFFLHITCATM